jgi:hypothetical protein
MAFFCFIDASPCKAKLQGLSLLIKVSVWFYGVLLYYGVQPRAGKF